jgi:hypothetical protein
MPKTPLATQCIPMTKPQILKAIRLCAKKLGRNPNLRDLRLLANDVFGRIFLGRGLVSRKNRLPHAL